ncbi:MAG: 2Fe-2S iron-sulfur cluster-binding protein [Casimicrobiaceae bacterium]
MPQLLTLFRAARLVGVRRGALQSKIKSGELAAFEGMVSTEDLLRVFPKVRLEDHAAMEKFETIKDAAFTRRMRERLLPSSDVLVARLAELGRQRMHVEVELEHHRSIMALLQAKLREPRDPATLPRDLAEELLDWLEQHLEPPVGNEEPEPLQVQENFLRIMTAHVKVIPSGREFFVDGNESVLEAALRAGLALDYGCSIGSCGKCKARIVSGEVHRTRHSDYPLTAAEKNAGVVLMCSNTAVGDLVIESREAHSAADMPLQSIDAKVKSVVPLTDDLRLLHLQTPRSNRLRFLAGQRVSLTLPGGQSASHPVASCPCDERNLHFHIRRRPGDAFSAQLFDALKDADTVRIEGPRGEFVLDEDSLRPLIFIAGETGFAPVKSLVEHALALDTAEMLHLYWVTSGRGGHYLDNLCRSWNDALDNFRYVPLTEDAALPYAMAAPRALQPLLDAHPALGDYDVYVAGPARLTNAAQSLLLLHGLPRAQLFIDTVEH